MYEEYISIVGWILCDYAIMLLFTDCSVCGSRVEFFRNIFLIGPMGAGKTTIGRFLAKALDYRFVDSDREIESRTGVNIPVIFDYEGEEGFRKREQEAISELAQLNDIVLATGGGAVIRSKNRESLSRNGFVVYLRCSVEQQLERTHRDSQRPLLNTPDPRAKLEELMAARESLYSGCAHFCVDTGQQSSRHASRIILRTFQARRELSARA